MDNFWNFIQIQHCSKKLWPGHRIWLRVHYDLDFGDMTLSQGHGQELFEIVSRSNKAVRSYGQDMEFCYMYTVTLKMWPWVSRSLHTLGQWTTIVGNIIQIKYGGMKLWPGQGQGNSYIPPNWVCKGQASGLNFFAKLCQTVGSRSQSQLDMCLWNTDAPRRQQSQNMAKSLSAKFWPHPIPRGMWCQWGVSNP